MRRAIPGLRALVTGASGGLGRAIAIELVRHGANVMLFARRENRLREVADEISKLGGSAGRAEIFVGDVTSPTARSAALEAIQAAFGGLDLLVNNAGAGAIGRFETADADRLRKIFELNFFAAAELTREALPLLKAGRTPMIVNVGSILGHRATPQNSEYCASKFALRGLSEALRIELQPAGVDLLLVTPGPTGTDFWDHLVDRQGEIPWTTSMAMPPERAARMIVLAIERGQRELIPSFRARVFVWFSRHFPKVVDRIMRRYA
jgi:short-subunit dehydrogenase